MTDKNGKEIKAGQVVLISGAYFKNDNGLWLVTNVPGAPDWHGRDICLQKIGKSGKLNTSKGRYGFWPIGVFTNDRMKRLEANAWNAEHATIEVLDNSAIKTWAEVKAFFEQLADGNRKYADMAEMRYGWSQSEVGDYRNMATYQQRIADGIPA